ncbi:MAG TPA: Spy/CpxP family protein refolding chaperone [Xanthobacteraceae bacterium]|nr:Spy/CpxP family protein refolding chaperone [Xanthobacteraceae bacterium]
MLLLALLTDVCSGGATHSTHHAAAASAADEDQHHEKGGPFFAAIGRTLQECGKQADELKRISPQAVIKAISLTDSQRTALESIRSSANSAAEKLEAACPRTTPGTLSGKLDALATALRLIADALNSVRPALAAFSESLDDEQKVRFAMTPLVAPPVNSDRRSKQRSSDDKSRASDDKSKDSAKSLCPEWATDLRSFPVKQIESEMQLSDTQHVAFYELAAAIYRSAGDLDQACPLESRITQLGRLDARENELLAISDDISAIRPFAVAFEDALNPTQKSQLADRVRVSSAATAAH